MTAAAGPGPLPDGEAGTLDWGWERHGQDQRDASSAATPA